MALLFNIGKKGENQSVIPETPTLKNTMTTPETTVQPSKFVIPKQENTVQKTINAAESKPTNAEVLASDLARGVSISQRPEDKAEPIGRGIPLVGKVLFGKGYSDLYEEGTVAGQVEEQGVVGFALEGFKRFANPNQKEVGERIYESYSKFAQEGIAEDRALDAAIQNVINNTSPLATNVQELRSLPETELTDDEKDIVFWLNARDDVFAVLDAPIFVGSTKPVKEGVEIAGRKLSDLGNEKLAGRAEYLRDTIIERAAQDPKLIEESRVDIINDSPELQAYIDNFKANPNPSISFLNEGIPLLSRSGRDATDIKQELQSVINDIAKDPATYLRDPKTGQFRGSVSNRVADITPFEDTGEVTAKTISDLEGRGSVSYQFIADSLKRPEVKQAERDVVTDVLAEYEPGAKINVQEFADKVKARLLPLESEGLSVARNGNGVRYENINLSPDLRGDVANYEEFIYQSPIKNSAGSVHFNGQGADSYFAHTRIEDMADDTTRRVIEVQSDLFQKGRLENERQTRLYNAQERRPQEYSDKFRERVGSEIDTELAQLQPYRNTWWERIIREEVKKAAQDGKAVLQFPTGETAMKIEGLGQAERWTEINPKTNTITKLEQSQLKTGKSVFDGNSDEWIITEVLDDGKFKAYPKDTYEYYLKEAPEQWPRKQAEVTEQFDISGKVDTNNPIYKFYEKDVQKYLTKKYGAQKVTDENGVSWIEMQVNKEAAERPVEAFAGAVVGIEENEDGDIVVDPTKAFLGMAAAGFLGMNFKKFKGRSQSRNTAVQGVVADRRAQQVLPGETSLAKETEAYSLSSSDLSDSLVKDYADEVGESIVDTEKALNPATLKPRSARPEDMTRYQKMREYLDNKWTDAMQWFQDDMVKWLNLVNNPNVKVTDDTDPWLAETLFHGRIGARMEAARDTFIAIDRDIITTAKTNGVPEQDMTTLVNKYLHSRHAPERNAKLGDGAAGITNAEAAAMQAEIKALPYGGEIERIANQVQEMNNQTLDVLLEAQVIDKEAYDAMRSTYQNHVPLQRVLKEDEDIVQALSGRGFDVKSTGIKRAKGSQREVADIMTNVVTNYEQALIRAEKNRVDLTTLAFARDNTHLGIFEEIKPKAIGRMFGEGGEATGAIIKEAVTDPRVLTLRENGKPVFLKIKNEDLAMALKGVSRHQVPSYMRGVQAFTRFYSGLQTRFNPEFALPNKIRDLQEATVYAGSRGELGFSGGIKGALDVRAYKDVTDHIRGVDSEGARLYQQMIDDGGTTGGMSLSTREAVELDIEEIRKLNRSNPRAAADKIIRTIDDFNTIFEDTTRLALYKQALNNGVSRKRAAQIAKESSINFNKFGRGGPIINSLWMFSNASIQGTTKMMRAMKNPKVAAAVSSSVFAGVYATGEWNDRLDPEWRDKVTEWDRINSLVVVLPSATPDDFNYFKIPVSWGVKPIKVGADYLYDASVGKGATAEEAFGGVIASAINAYNPVGGTDLLSGITPTIADIPSEIYRNMSWHGGKIMPDWDARQDHLRYFPSLTDNTTGQMAVDISYGLSGVGIEVSPASIYYAYQGYVGGAGRTLTDTVNTMISVGRGEMPNPNDIPIYSRFVTTRDVDEIGAGSNEHERVKQLRIEEDSAKAILQFDAEAALKRLQSVDQGKAADMFDQIIKEDPELAQKINDLLDEQELGLTYTQRNLKGLTVESRANFIYDKLESLETDEEKAELWDEYVEKKIITDSVAEQINNIYDGTAGESERPRYKDGQTTTQRSFIGTMMLYAEAIGTDPVTAFNRMFTGQRIRRIDGGAIIVERMPFEDSQAVRDERGATSEMRLDHTLPLQLGGSNAEDNLKLIPYEDWERYTAVENMLGDALRDERIDAKKAKQLILDFKNGTLTSQQVRDAIDNI